MVKKKVPDWLNSSLWSTAPSSSSSDDLSQPHPSSSVDSMSAAISPTATTIDANFKPPILVRPPTVTSPPPRAQKPDIKDKNSRSIISSNSNSSSNSSIHMDEDRDDENVASAAGPSAEDVTKQAQLSTELSKKVVNLKELRKIASQGLPDGAGIRSTVWKLLLGYLPPERSQWSSELAKKRPQYKNFKDELLMNPSEITRKLEKSIDEDSKLENRCMLSRSEINHDEHPLSLGKTSIWNKYFQDSEIIEQIDRDVKRTHPDLHFFCGDSSFAKSNQESLKSILIVFAKLNPGIRYVQGMNEIVAPLYYVFKNDPDEEMASCAEADTFFCFVELLSGFRDNFCQQLDNSVVGIRSTITKLSQLLKEHDEELWRHLEITTKIVCMFGGMKQVNPQFYAFRWITLLLTQEFNFADSLHIWDTLLSDPQGPQETLLRICCAMLILIRRRLLAGDFTSILKLLQKYPPTNISHLLYVANKLRPPPSC
ncbi:TBC1 domain family member 13 [Linum perenne]